MEDILKIGDEVTRGPDWRYGQQDGTSGAIGTVIEHDFNSDDEDRTWYIVEWPDGNKDAYIYEEGKHEIIRAKAFKPIETKEPEEVTVKIKRMDKNDFKNALKGIK